MLTSVSTQLLLVLISLLLVLPVVEALGAGDAISLLLGVVLSITSIWACLEVSAGKRNAQMWLSRASWIKPYPEILCAISVKPALLCLRVPRNSKYGSLTFSVVPIKQEHRYLLQWKKNIFFIASNAWKNPACNLYRLVWKEAKKVW